MQYIDHVIVAAADLERAASDYENRLRLSVSPGGVHPGAGTHNRLVVLDPEYIELIARVPGAALNPSSPITPMFSRSPGPIGFALASDDLDADVAALRDRGVLVDGPVEGRLEGPHGLGRGWRTARVAGRPGLAPDVWRLPFVIQHDSGGAERLNRITAPDGPKPHPIGATYLSHVTLSTNDMAATLNTYRATFGLEHDGEGEDVMLRARTARVPLPHGSIFLAEPLDADSPVARDLRARGEGLFSFTVAVEDLRGAVDALRARGVGVMVEEPEGVLVAARLDVASAHGARVELVTAHRPH